MTFYISYTGNTSLTIDGISQIELKDKRTGKVFAGGTASEVLGDNRFANPIHLDKGEGAWFAIIFAPGTWYDLNIPDLYSESGEENCAVQAVVTNYHAEAAQ